MKTPKRFMLVTCAVALCAAGAYAIWRTSVNGGSSGQTRKILYYQDSMHPWIKSDKPGKCTVCVMDLTPILEGDAGFANQSGLVVLSSNSVTVLDVQTEEVQRRPLQRTLRVAGTLEASETSRTVVSAPAVGRVDSLMVEYTGVEVEAGQRLVTFYSPGFANQSRRFAFLGRLAAPALGHSAEGADKDSPDMGDMENGRPGAVPSAQSADPRKRLDSSYFTDLLAPQTGTVVERSVSKGQYVQEGEKLLTIVDSSVLWFRFDAYDQHLPWLEPGQKITVSVQAIPGKTFPATIAFIEPTINEVTRTVRVRADVENPLVESKGQGPRRRLLRYGMFAEGQLQSQSDEVTAVPRSAILLPGDRAYAFVQKGTGAYERREVKLGRQGDQLWEVIDGLDEGDRVVTSGNVLLDAQAQFSQGGESEPVCCHKKDSAVAASAGAPPANPDASATSHDAHPAHGMNGMIASETSSVAASSAVPANQASAAGVAPRGGRRTNDKLGAIIGSRLSATRSGSSNTVAPPQPAAGDLLAGTERKVVEEFLLVADGISQALAGDNLPQYNEQSVKLRTAIPAMEKSFPAPHRWSGLVRRFAMLNQMPPAKDLAEARKQFLPFSVSVVELAKQLRKEDESFARLKVYYCPMAPKPGLWFQAKGPLRNPYYGAEMLSCGEEVKGDGNPAISKLTARSK